MNTRAAGLRKQTKESTAEQLCMDNIPMALNESNISSVSDSSEVSVNIAVITVKFPNFYRTFSSLDSIFFACWIQ